MVSGSQDLPARLARRLSEWLLAHSRAVLAVAVLLCAGGFGLGSRLELQTDLAELLPPDAPSVVELKALAKRVGGTGNIAIALAGEPSALRSYIPKLVAALKQRLGSDLLTVKYQRKEVDDYFQRFAAYYIPVDHLERWQARLSRVVAEEKARANPAFVELDGEPHAEAKRLIADVRSARQAVGPGNVADPETGFLMAEGGHLAVIFVRPAASSLNIAGSSRLLDRIRDIVDATRPAGVRLEGFTGSIPKAVVELQAIRRDIVGTAFLVVVLVGGVVGLFFHSLRELVLLSAALLVGVAIAFAFAFLWIGHVNAQTAFLGSIIVGTGINYGIILLARYVELRREGVALEPALEQAMATALRPTAIAAGATAVSFGVLAAGKVESFHQFGWIGGIGIIACWAATFTVVPAALIELDRRRRYRLRTSPQPLRWLCRNLAEVVARAPHAAVAGCAMATALALVGIWYARHHALETDMRKLETKSSLSRGIDRLDQRLRKMDTASSTPAVVATSSREQAEEVCGVMRALAERTQHRFMWRCHTIASVLPDQPERRGLLLARLRAEIDRVPLEALDAGDRRELGELARSLGERPPGIGDLPPTLVEPFTERDGSVGKLAFVEPRDDEVAENLFAFADALRTIRLPSGPTIHSSGEDVVFADVLHAVATDASRLTAAAALLVLVLLALLTRRSGSFARVGLALVLGVFWLAGLAALLHQKLNFFNFVALPTTFGIGIDYAINVEERLRQRRASSLGEVLAEVGPAVALASATTILGYVSLLIADNQALVSFGALAILGEVTCLAAAFILVPALWAWKRADST